MIVERFIARTGPATAMAGKAGKNKKAKKRCKNQQAQCATAVSAYCAPQADPLLCESTFLPCCTRVTGCNVEAGIACIFATFLGPD